LAVTGVVSGAHALTIAGSGRVKLSSDNTYSLGTTVGNGADTPTLLLANGHNSVNSATGSGSLTVKAGCDHWWRWREPIEQLRDQRQGHGWHRRQRYGRARRRSHGVTGLDGYRRQFDLQSEFGHHVGITAGNELNPRRHTSYLHNTTLTLNLTGSSIIAPNTAYVLITDSNGFANSGLTLGANGQINGRPEHRGQFVLRRAKRRVHHRLLLRFLISSSVATILRWKSCPNRAPGR